MVNQVPPWCPFWKNNTVLTQVFLRDVVYTLKQPEFPIFSRDESVCLYNKVSSLCLTKASQSGVRQCVRMYLRASESRKLVCDSLWVYALKFPLMKAWVVYMHVSFNVCVCVCVFMCHFIGLLVTPLSESLFTPQWPVWGSSSKCHPPPALSMFLKFCIRHFPTHFLIFFY